MEAANKGSASGEKSTNFSSHSGCWLLQVRRVMNE